MAAAAARRPAARAPQQASRKAADQPAPQQGPGRGLRGAAKLPRRKTAAPLPVVKATMPAPSRMAQAVAPQPPEEQVFDVRASASAPAQPQPAPVRAPVADNADAWQPVAVPPPTYTMKERAPERPQQAPAPTSNPKSYEHVANEDLPFDGLALDQDLDDLPSVFRAG